MSSSRPSNTGGSFWSNASATSTHRSQRPGSLLSDHMSSLGTETIGYSQTETSTISLENASSIASSSADHTQPSAQTLGWLWNIDRPWEGFNPPSASRPQTAQDNNGDNSGDAERVGPLSSPPRRVQATQRRRQGKPVGRSRV
ncbi:hypothetical protein FSARC_6310 [Fusarium sarcochroum]|uniref:Uncharacterized protein n=1 Tax=Fusarium sarcochroum TaxID=1208366 RepID=A0A8H4TXE1_9HYPO|nr:hypothetical protein FSARC_6310 [Fusarium sarcochroum]